MPKQLPVSTPEKAPTLRASLKTLERKFERGEIAPLSPEQNQASNEAHHRRIQSLENRLREAAGGAVSIQGHGSLDYK